MEERRIAILLMAGALGGAAVMRVWDGPRAPAPKAAAVRVKEQVPASKPAPVIAMEPVISTSGPPVSAPVASLPQPSKPAPKSARKALPSRRVAPAITAANQPTRARSPLMELLRGGQNFDNSPRVVSVNSDMRPQSPVVLLQIVIVENGGSAVRYRITAANPFSDDFDLVDLLKQLTDTVSVSKRSYGRAKVADSFRDW